MIRTTIYLPDEVHLGLKLLAVKNKTNMTAIIVELLGKHAMIDNPDVAKKVYPKAFTKPDLTEMSIEEMDEAVEPTGPQCEIEGCTSKSQGYYKNHGDTVNTQRLAELQIGVGLVFIQKVVIP